MSTEKILPQKISSVEALREAQVEASRMGRFSISAGLFTHDPGLVRKVLGWLEFYPHLVVSEQDPPRVDYMGQSPRFEALAPGDMVPEYYIRVRQCDDGMAFSVERQVESLIVVPGR